MKLTQHSIVLKRTAKFYTFIVKNTQVFRILTHEYIFIQSRLDRVRDWYGYKTYVLEFKGPFDAFAKQVTCNGRNGFLNIGFNPPFVCQSTRDHEGNVYYFHCTLPARYNSDHKGVCSLNGNPCYRPGY